MREIRKDLRNIIDLELTIQSPVVSILWQDSEPLLCNEDGGEPRPPRPVDGVEDEDAAWFQDPVYLPQSRVEVVQVLKDIARDDACDG